MRMRKGAVLAVLLIIVFGGLLVGCAGVLPDNFGDAVAQARKVLSDYRSSKYNGYSYTYVYPEDREDYFSIVMVPDDSSGYARGGVPTEFICRSSAEPVYNEVAKRFSRLDVELDVIVCGKDGQRVYVFDNGDFE